MNFLSKRNSVPWNTIGDKTSLFSIDNSLYDGKDLEEEDDDNGKL